MGKRFSILIGVAAAGVMALGAQTGAQTPAPTPPPPTCNGLAATIVGTEGPDDNSEAPGGQLIGTPGRDVIVALGGSDFISGGPGNDVICGGDGRDFLVGSPGNDTLLGQAGSDALAGAKGKDRCDGGKGNDSTYDHAFGPVPKPPDYCEVEKSIEKSGAIVH
jgi:hypothetical protein